MEKNLVTTDNEFNKELPKVWFDKEYGFYKIFTKGGVELTHIINISVNNPLEGLINCDLKCQCEVVNSKPESSVD